MKILLDIDKTLTLRFETELAEEKHKNGFITKSNFIFDLMGDGLKKREDNRKNAKAKKEKRKNALTSNLRK